MDNRDRRCALCGQLNPPTAEFCAECGVFLASVPASTLARVRQTQFALPDYLLMAREREREERRRRMNGESGEGVGLLWIGAIAALVALWFGGGIGPGAFIFPLGILGALIGLWRLRRDPRNMARAGTATVVVSSVVLGAALAQTLGFAGSQVVVPERAIAVPTPTPDVAEAPALALAAHANMPMFRGTAARTGENPGPAPVERPIVKWKAFVGGETYASPVVGADAVFVATKAGSVVALGLGDGQERWRIDVGDYIARSTPALSGDTLFVAAGYALSAIDAENGQLRWRVALRFAGSCSPVVADGRVYVATQEGHVSAFAPETGEELWHYRNDNLLFGSPAISDNTLVIADEAGQVTALEASTGRERWQKAIGGDAYATPAIADGVVYVATNEPSLVALDLKSGKELWQRGVGGESSPALHDGVLYLGGSDQSVRALDAKTGEARWSSPLGYAIQSSAIVSDDAVFIASGPTLNALSRADGHPLWTHVTGDDVSADLAVVGGMVIASSHDGYVYALGAPEAKTTPVAPAANSGKGVSLDASR
jgi:outer membrane protein assembly factor BamB